MKILMVCLGNICRSPLAEGLLKEKVRKKGLYWEVESAGTGSWHVGEQPDPRSMAVARKYGIDISDQRARQFRRSDFREYDYIFAMDGSNLRDIQNLNGGETGPARVELILDRIQPDANVPDPYWDDNGFEKVYQLLDKATDQLLADLMAESG